MQFKKNYRFPWETFDCRNEVLHIGNLVEEMKKYDDVDEQTLWWINKELSYSGYLSHVEKQKNKRTYRGD